ncbi:uncharacterized protein EKO05_0010479 [Ascochyta rabiei]|uniref:uncharacterized protein n=1 Tax=Didymella rabiei TaxID=5454 RepID=UPI0019016423|nr:uncharacterized protein EKO05_0010479 [Ascochyta rabiei]UPX20239.1 hypothetical protein EKO05_0010479 [Ascochyta rabiei]
MQVHWDHVGEPRKFPTSTFVVGHGALSLLAGTSPKFRGSPSFFEPDLLPPGRSIELSNPRAHAEKQDSAVAQGTLSFGGPRLAHGILPQILDLFNDGSLLIFNAPGHLPGHINILSRTADGRRVYLGGDSCHDRRLLTGVKEIGEWTDAKGHVCCIHADREEAGETIRRTRMLEQEGVEVIIAHDDEWEDNPANKTRFFGAG